MSPHSTFTAFNKMDDDHHLLIVDSDTDSLAHMSKLLLRLDHNLKTATTGIEALEHANRDTPALIIFSSELSDMDGLDMLRKLRENPRCMDVPFVAIIDRHDIRGHARCLHAGAVDCIERPITRRALYRAVATEMRTLLHVEINNLHCDELNGACIAAISEQGVFVHTPTPIDVGRRLAIEIDICGHVIVADTEVLYTHQVEEMAPYGLCGMGLEFIAIDPDDRKTIRKFIKHEAKQRIHYAEKHAATQ